MSDSPSENTLTVNVTHRQLQSLDPPFTRLVAIAPTRTEEGAHRDMDDDPEGGYDISLETAKEVVFQHKRPHDITTHDGTDWLKFSVDTDQCWALAEQYELGQAFLALPIVPTEDELPHCLKLTVFVDVHLVNHFDTPNWMPDDGDSISNIYIERSDNLIDHIKQSSDLSNIDDDLAPSVYIKSNSSQWKIGGPAYQDISMSDFHSPTNGNAIAWPPLAEYLKSCRYGVRIRGGNADYPTAPLDDRLHRFRPENLENVSPAYRNRVARTNALAAAATGNIPEMDQEQLATALTEDIITRRKALDDFFRLEVDPEAVSARTHHAVQHFWGNQDRFQQIAQNTRRNIFEGGRNAPDTTIR